MERSEDSLDDIGRYRIIGELGSGGMGIVYRAFDPVLGREVAIKTLKLSELSDPAERDALRERLGREARAAAALSHPGIVTVHDVVQQDGDHISMVMERIEGQTLAHILFVEPALEVSRVLRILREAAAALDYAHRKGIVHRDIKPANLMLDENGTVKIADFGIAKITTSQTRTQSASGMIVGTAGYMAPEQLRGTLIEGFADQFSLAVVAYEMLSRRRPFMADSLIALTHQVVFEEAPTLSTLRPGLGLAVDAVFQKALAKSPAERYASCSAFAAALESQINTAVTAQSAQTLAYATVPVTPPPTLAPTQALTQHSRQPVRQPPSHPPRSRRLMAIIAIFVIPAAAGLAAIYFLRHAPAPPPVVAQKATPAPQTASVPLPTAVAKDSPPVEPVAPVPKDPPPAAKTKAPSVPVLKAGTIRINKKDGQKYAWIPPGSFTMGCIPNDKECGSFAKPAHRVTISAGFWMAQTATTVAAYRAFIEASHGEMPKTPRFNPNWSLTDHPIVEVNWDDAKAYCSRAGGRLPTEAEWEYAARGGASDTLFPWGNDSSHDFANFGRGTKAADEEGAVEGKDQWVYTSPVGSFPANGFQLYDMIGNVSQWCSDWYSPSYYAKSPEENPKGPETGTLRVVRGGSWKSPARFTHSSYRGSRAPEERGMTSGFRCVVNSLP